METVRVIIPWLLLVHGLGHGGAFAALIWIAYRPESDTGAWRAARSWLFPSLPAKTATVIVSIFWILSLIGFTLAALAFWNIALPQDAWRQLAVASSIVSTTGLLLFFGIWPIFNTLAALAVNIAVLVTQLWLNRPP